VNSENSRQKEVFFRAYGFRILLWLGITSAVAVLLHFNVDKKLITIMTLTLGLLTKAFAGLGAVVSLIPVVGPLIVKVLTFPFFWVVNGLGYFVSVIAIKKGYTKEMVRSRVLTVALLIGILIGYILGHLLPIR
jgi:hypothetical protein